MSSGDAVVPMTRHRNPGNREAGFTLLEIVVSLTIFALIVVTVLADREDSLRMTGEARLIQVSRTLAYSKIDEIRHDPAKFGETDQGDFEEIDPDEPLYRDFTWDLEIERVLAVGQSSDSEDDFLFPEDEDREPETDAEGKPLSPRYVRRLTLTVRYEPDGVTRGDLSLRIVTFLPPDPDDEQEAP